MPDDNPHAQNTAPPLWMNRQDRAKLEALSWNAHGLFWAVQMWLVDGGNDFVMRLPKRKLAVAAARRAPAKMLEAAALELVEEGVWADAGSDWEIVLHHQIPIDEWRDPVRRERGLRGKRLRRDTDLCRRIRERDRELCRYCGVRTSWGTSDRVSDNVGEFDHVDPSGGNEFENVVVSCRRCNQKKKDRTPEQAGMPLYTAGSTADTIAAGRARLQRGAAAVLGPIPGRKARSTGDPPDERPGSDLGQTQVRPGSSTALSRAPARLRTDPGQTQVGPRSGPALPGGGDVAPPLTDEELMSLESSIEGGW